MAAAGDTAGRAPEHRAVDGGFQCPNCGATRETPLGMERHRAICTGREGSA